MARRKPEFWDEWAAVLAEERAAEVAAAAAKVVNLRAFPKTGRSSFLLPADVVRVDRGSPWGNPYKFERTGSRDVQEAARLGAIRRYERYAIAKVRQEPDWLTPLVGKRLACWCAPAMCHANVLIELLAARNADGTIRLDDDAGKLVFGVDRLPKVEAESAPAWRSLDEIEAERDAAFATFLKKRP